MNSGDQFTEGAAEERADSLAHWLAAAPSADADTATLTAWLRDGCALGLHVLFIEPGTKLPVDMRTPAERREDDGAAQNVARMALNPRWDKVRSKSGVYLATDDPDRLAEYLTRYREKYGADTPVNIGVAVGPSGLLVVDVDTAEQAKAFRTLVAEDESYAPTVTSPGQKDKHGNWAHKDGGHYHYVLPSGMNAPGVRNLGDAGDVKSGPGTYVLLPPSVRAEGPYTVTGPVRCIPGALASLVASFHVDRAPGVPRSASNGPGGSEDTWAVTVEWDELLTARGWLATDRPDTCSCPIWTAPGEHASPKSATAHGEDCTLRDGDPRNRALHVWTDCPGPELEAWFARNGTKDISKFDFVAAGWFAGDRAAARGALVEAIGGPDLSFGPEAQSLGFGDPASAEDEFEKEVEAQLRRLLVNDAAQRRKATIEAGTVELPPVTGLADLLAEDDDPVRFRIQDVFPSGGARIIFAAPEKAGKTTLLGNLTRSLADGDPFLDRFAVNTRAERIMIIDNEMSKGMLRRWLRRQGIRDIGAVADVVTLRGQAGLFDLGNDKRRAEWAQRMRDQGIDFVIFDCLRPVLDALGLDENRETGKFLGPFDQLLAEAGCRDAVIAHHMGHQNERARGDSRIVGWSDGNWKVVRHEEAGEAPKFFFSAKVRDGDDVPEGLLSYDASTGHLMYAGGNRSEAKAAGAVEKKLGEILDVLADHEVSGGVEMNTTEIKGAVGGNKAIIATALGLADERKLVTVRRQGRSILYRIVPAARDPLTENGG